MYYARMSTDTITCPTHGESQFAFVCQHLLANPVQPWYCGYPEEDAQWRDAWCAECDLALEREGEWNENNEDEAGIQLICCHCYEHHIGQSVNRLQGPALEAWTKFVDGHCATLSEKQSAMTAQLRLDDYPRWDYYQERAQLVFSGGELPELVADIEFIGTLSTASNTWMWSWANFSLLEGVRSRIAAVRDAGEERDYPHLTVPIWEADMHDGWHMTAIAVEQLQAMGAYRVPSDNGYIFMAILSAQHRPAG